jgi:hypothetical protein
VAAGVVVLQLGDWIGDSDWLSYRAGLSLSPSLSLSVSVNYQLSSGRTLLGCGDVKGLQEKAVCCWRRDVKDDGVRGQRATGTSRDVWTAPLRLS